MNALGIIAAINAGLALVESLLPLLDIFKASGEITAEQQQELLNKYNSLKNKADGQFAGPEWQVRP